MPAAARFRILVPVRDFEDTCCSLTANRVLPPCSNSLPLLPRRVYLPNECVRSMPVVTGDLVYVKKALRISGGALLPRGGKALINFDKVRIAYTDHAFRKYKAVNVDRDPAAVHEHEVRVPD